MDNVCMSVADMILFLEILKPYIINFEYVDGYVFIQNFTATHVYEEQFGEVCHVLGYDHETGEVIRHSRGEEL